MGNFNQKNLLVIFCDLTNYAKISRKIDETEVFMYLSKIYEIIGEIIESSCGQIIKFIGDAVLITFDENDIDKGIIALKKLKTEIDSYNQKINFESQLIIKAHFGQVIAGMIGTKSKKMYDIFGNVVNIAATLPSNGFTISVETFRQLKPETRKLFKKHTPPVTYIGVDEKHK
jgi:class 3 adenylate cyclase